MKLMNLKTCRGRCLHRPLTRIVSIILLFTMLFGITSSLDFSAFAETYISGDYEYTILNDGTAEITKYNGSAAEVEIPLVFTEYIITRIGNYAFKGCTGLAKVTIPEGVTRIGDMAFVDCESLVTVSIPDSVISIGRDAFSGTALYYNTYNIDNWQNGLLYIDDFLVDVRPSMLPMLMVVVKDGTTVIADGLFSQCFKLTSVTIPSSVTNLGEGLFPIYPSAMENVSVERNNKNYSSQDGVLFNKDKTELIYYPKANARTSYVIPDSVKTINKSAFERCTGLTSITISNSVKIIDDHAFEGCTGLSKVTILEGVTSINFMAFRNCNNLTEVYLPRALDVIGSYVFENCPNIKDVYYNGVEKNWNKIFISDSGNSCLFNADIHFAEFKTSDFQYAHFDDGTIEILKYIGTSSNVVIPSEIDGHKVTAIGYRAFADCTNLKNVTFSENLLSIGNYAFSNCSSLTFVDLHDTRITNIGLYAFKNCMELLCVNLPPLYKEICDGTFYGCSQLEIISLDNIINIDEDAFGNCISLTELKLHGNICMRAFMNCKSLEFVEVDSSFYFIESQGFAGCDNLKQIIFSNGLHYVGSSAFSSCSNLKDVYYYGTQNQWNNINFTKSCFEKTNAVIHYILKDKTENFEYTTSDFETAEIWKYYGEDPSCVIPKIIDNCKVTGIAAYAFADNQTLVDVTIPNTVISIEHEAFGECINLKNVYYLGTKDEWNRIIIDYSWGSNFFLNNASIHFYDSIQSLFTDLIGYNFYNDYVNYTSVYNSFIAGTNPPYYTEFSPTKPITRAMLIAILYRMAGNPYDANNPHAENPFTDIKPGAYYYNAACWALDEGITNQTTFKPNDNVTREQTARFLYAYAEANDLLGDEAYKNVNLTRYPDYNKVHSWAVEPLQWANYNDMITGTQQGYINPQGATQRIHATRILYGFGKVCNIGNFE